MQTSNFLNGKWKEEAHGFAIDKIPQASL
jgi:hypothetical protein